MKRRELLKAASLFPFLGLKNLASQDENKPVPQNLYMSQESFDDFKNWSVDEIDELTRKEIYQKLYAAACDLKNPYVIVKTEKIKLKNRRGVYGCGINTL